MNQHNPAVDRNTNTTALVYLALGSNVGDRKANLRTALEQLPPHVFVEHCSAVYETEPAYVVDQERFLNMVVEAQTPLPPHDLLRWIKTIEQQVGRTTTFRYGPRVVDLDILLYDNLELDTPDLTIPHPRMAERAFVLVPLAELAPDLILPQQTTTVAGLAAQVGQQGEIVRTVGHF
jgi:2-amino-4-hydroxy-6-hydroxymethyldihydropteridine diphosphokinase